MKRAAVFLILLCILRPPVLLADARPEGLLWNRSGHAATLPLLVKTDPGQDYLLTLRDTETDREVLAAYIRGGEFFGSVKDFSHILISGCAGCLDLIRK